MTIRGLLQQNSPQGIQTGSLPKPRLLEFRMPLPKAGLRKRRCHSEPSCLLPLKTAWYVGNLSADKLKSLGNHGSGFASEASMHLMLSQTFVAVVIFEQSTKCIQTYPAFSYIFIMSFKGFIYLFYVLVTLILSCHEDCAPGTATSRLLKNSV